MPRNAPVVRAPRETSPLQAPTTAFLVGNGVPLKGSIRVTIRDTGSFEGPDKGSMRGLRVSIVPVWFLVGNGGMDYGDYWGIYRDYHRDPFPHSLLRTRQMRALGFRLEEVGGLGDQGVLG